MTARLLSAGGAAIRGLARSPLASLGGRLIGEGTEGPTDDTRRRDTFHVVVDARRSNVCDQRLNPLSPSIRSAVTRTMSPDRRTLPSSR